MGFPEDHIRPQRRASRRCNYLTSDPSRPRSSTTPISCPARAWSRRWRWRSSASLAALADERLTVPTDKGANAGRKITSLVAGMVAGADSIDDMALLRHGAMGTIFDHPYAPSTLGSFLREFTFGHVRQLDAVGSRFLCALADRTRSSPGSRAPSWWTSTTRSSKSTGTVNKVRDTATPGCAG